MAKLDARTDDFIRMLLDVSGRARPADIHGVDETEAAALLQEYASAHPERSLGYVDGMLSVVAPVATTVQEEPPAIGAVEVPAHEAWAAAPAAPADSGAYAESVAEASPAPASEIPQWVYEQPAGEDPYAVPADYGVSAAPAAPDPYAAPVAPDPYSAPAAPGPYAAPAAPDAYPVPSAPDPYAVPASPDPYAVPAAPDPYAAPASPDPYAAPAAPDPYAAPDAAGSQAAGAEWIDASVPTGDFGGATFPDEPPLQWFWWLVPLFFSLLGGVVAWLVLRDRQPKGARKLLFFGIGITVVSFLLGVLSAVFGLGALMTSAQVGFIGGMVGILTA